LGLQDRVNDAVRQTLDRGEDLVAAAAVNDVIPAEGSWPQLFRPHKVLALTTKRMLLLEYYGMIGRHAEIVAACRRESATGNLTKFCGLRLMRINRGPGPAKTYRAYIRCSKNADLLGRGVEQQALTDLRHQPGSQSS
jgi:hypothetical protein